MAYTNNVPQASQQISQTQSLIQANFLALSSFGNGYAELSNQGSAPVFSAGNDGLYTLNNATTTANETYIHIQRVAPADAPADIPMSASVLSNSTMATSADGWSYLPSGLLIKWGSVAAPGASVAITPTVTSGGPNFNRVLKVYVTAFDSGVAVDFACGQRTVADNTSGNFSAYCSNPSATTTVGWLILGV